MKPNKLAYLILLVMLTGCKANQDSLEEFVSKVEEQARKEVAQLKPASEFIAAIYDPQVPRGPFVLPKEAIVQDQPIAKKDCWQPSYRSKNGKLEKFPLNKLRLKGVMGSGSSVSGLVQTPIGNVVKIQKGQFIGLNNGRVIKVTNKYVLINETLPDGLGCWHKRNVKLALK
ncbi:pilus assembly protein PilP [Vibrio sp. 99-70-13A1]|uniref:pilus assembly protein PilP n=1 Tax=Vibrio sp. 99-70-13A1 TaxID=2607601 RepID=UPI001493D6BF|nr:pilus assembly protein PilP [Vibrio sp. 99-70-13A1]NOH96560.1 fimbrial protein [Vibrio sp. 99-70-13A1]